MTLGCIRACDVACQMAAAMDRRFDFSHVITFDPTMHRMWPRTVSVSRLILVNRDGPMGQDNLDIASCH